MTLSVAICGGGALAHSLAGVIGARPGVRVTLLTRRPDAWRNYILVHHQNHVVVGAVEPTSDSFATAGADLILVAAPAFAHAAILARVVPHLRPETWVGALPAIGGFDRLVGSLVPRHERVLGSLRAPYNARIMRYGRDVEVSGVVPRLDLVSAIPERFPEAVALVTELLGLPIRALSPFILATLSPAGTIFHPARIFELLAQADASRQRFYSDWGVTAASTYLEMDRELACLRRHLGCDAPGLDALSHYGASDAASLMRRIRSLPGLPDVGTPFRNGRLDQLHRFICEDLPFGLGLACDIATRHGVQAPTMARVRTAIATAAASPCPPNRHPVPL